MSVQYAILSIAGWVWTLVALGYLFWRLGRESADAKRPGFPVILPQQPSVNTRHEQ